MFCWYDDILPFQRDLHFYVRHIIDRLLEQSIELSSFVARHELAVTIENFLTCYYPPALIISAVIADDHKHRVITKFAKAKSVLSVCCL